MALSDNLNVEKNKVATPEAWLVTADVTLTDGTKYALVKNDEDIAISSSDFESAGLIGHWKMNDDAATKIVLDSSDSSNGGVSKQNTDDLSVAGKVDGALDFSTLGDEVLVEDFNSLPDTEITVCGWCYYNTNKDFNFVIGHDWNNDGWLLYSDSNGQPIFGIAQGGIKVNTVSSYTITPGEWVHLIGTYNGSTLKIYVNAIEVGSVNLANAIFSDTGEVTIGNL